jgi:hypothetical protein
MVYGMRRGSETPKKRRKTERQQEKEENSTDNVRAVFNGQDYGNSPSYLVRRLKRDFPDIADALARGEYQSARSAGIAAGIVKINRLQEAKCAWRKLSAEERQAFSDWIFSADAQR